MTNNLWTTVLLLVLAAINIHGADEKFDQKNFSAEVKQLLAKPNELGSLIALTAQDSKKSFSQVTYLAMKVSDNKHHGDILFAACETKPKDTITSINLLAEKDADNIATFVASAVKSQPKKYIDIATAAAKKLPKKSVEIALAACENKTRDQLVACVMALLAITPEEEHSKLSNLIASTSGALPIEEESPKEKRSTIDNQIKIADRIINDIDEEVDFPDREFSPKGF